LAQGLALQSTELAWCRCAMDSLEVGTKLHAKFTDGQFYPAEVVSVSDSKKRAKAPIKVHYVGYWPEDEAWLPLASLKSKKLPKAAAVASQKKSKLARSKGIGLPKQGMKLYYWPATGKAHAIRLCLAEVGVEWEDVVFDKENKDLPVYASATSLPTHASTKSYTDFCAMCREMGGNFTTNLPMLEVEGKFYTQSHAVYRFVARKTGLYPKRIEDGYVVDNILAHVEDARKASYDILFAGGTAQDFLDKTSKHVANLERLLGDADFFLPDVFTLADILVFDLLHNFYKAQVPTVLEGHPRLSAFYDRVAGRTNIAAYLASEQCARIDKFVQLPSE